jgi:hypothetical protein
MQEISYLKTLALLVWTCSTSEDKICHLSEFQETGKGVLQNIGHNITKKHSLKFDKLAENV